MDLGFGRALNAGRESKAGMKVEIDVDVLSLAFLKVYSEGMGRTIEEQFREILGDWITSVSEQLVDETLSSPRESATPTT